MDCSIPVLKKYCFFFPLHPGLLVHAYIKLIISVAVEILYAHTLVTKRIYASLIGLTIAIIIVDAAANIVFIIGGHKKNITCVSWYYTYSFYLLTFKTFGLFVLSLFHPIPWQVLPNIFIHMYLLLLIRSELIQLSNETAVPCEFENKLSNPNCSIRVVKIEILNPDLDPEKGVEARESKDFGLIQNNDKANNIHQDNEIEKGTTGPEPLKLAFE